MKRKKYKKSKKINCDICNNQLSPQGLPSHIKYVHKIKVDDYVKKYGEFRSNHLNKKKGNRVIRKVECGICNNTFSIVGIYTHLRDSHDITVNDYVEKYGEYRPKYIDYKSRAEQNKIECMICHNNFGSERLLSFHIRIDHKTNKTDYVMKYIFDDKPQYCKCGCGQLIRIIKRPPYRVDYKSGHNPNGMIGKNHSKTAKQIMTKKAILRIGKSNKSNTLPEKEFKKFLIENDIEFIHQYPSDFGSVDFYLPEQDIFIEIDGEYWHPVKREYLNFQLLSSSISDYRKSKINNLYRIGSVDINKLKNIEDIKSVNRILDFSLTYHQKIMTKEYFKNYINKKGKEKLHTYIPLLLKFIRTFHSEFPYLLQRENLTDTIQKISKYDLSRIYDSKSKTFRNNISSLGVNYLKSNFESYWHSSFRDNKTPVDAWNDDEIMKKVVKYRIGLNNSNEVFDFSLHQLIRGLSARRYTISFFKPLLAAAIYKHFLGDIKNPIVIDPCAGFGGRMLGFKSVYPNGKYIGIEPNIDTYNELVKLSKNFSSIQLHNCKLEDYVGNKDCDLTFTSIPYFDKETYSKNVKYNNFKHWKSTFIENLMSYNNLIINLPKDLEELFTNYTEKYFIQNNTSHFNRNQNIKNELLIAI